MAKPVAPLIAFDARGTIAKTAVYSSWRGRSYVRRWTTPANPQTTAQMDTRNVFKWLSELWKTAPADFQTPWTAAAKGMPLTDRNALMKANVSNLRLATDLSAFVFSPGAAGGLPPNPITITPGSGQLTVASTSPTPPIGWTATNFFAACIEDQDPHSGLLFTITIGNDTTSPYSVILTGLAHTQLYRVGAWMTWTKPDLSVAYSASLQGSGTTT
jgi:hypothetical protein